MGVIISLLVSIVFAAIIVWVADWTARPQTALDILNQHLARGDIDRAEYDEDIQHGTNTEGDLHTS